MLTNLRILLAVLITFTAVAMATGATSGDTRPTDACTIATLESIQLPGERAIDEIRVVLADHSPEHGAIDVRVAGEETDRVIHMRGSSTQHLSFTPALSAASFDLSIEPVAGADRDACVARVVLVEDGAVVATIAP